MATMALGAPKRPSGIDHPDLETALLKDLVKGDPVDARRFQSHRLHSASLEPS